ncbi:hypothetical protein [Streptomyces sp. NPDC023327]|uniref:hypothetical protein n=1 Tax=Streptomyces sp. NPDC023327 TaxID=3157088 RepID=UPI0033DEC4C1
MTSKRTGITKFVDEVVDSTRDLTDGILDRLSDAEHDFRKGLTRVVENRDTTADNQSSKSSKRSTADSDIQAETASAARRSHS